MTSEHDGAEDLRAGHQGAAIARDRIESVLLRMPDVSAPFDREGVRDRLLRAIQAAYAVLDTGPLALVHLEGLTEADRLVDEASRMLPAGPDTATLRPMHGDLGMARTALTAGRETVARHQLAHRTRLYAGELGMPPTPRPFRASVGVPNLFALARRSLLPEVDVAPRNPPKEPPRPAPTVPRPTSFEELAALAGAARSGSLFEELGGPDAPLEVEPLSPPPPPSPFEPAIEEKEVVRQLAQAYLDRVAGGRALRVPNPIETWGDIAHFDQRILDALDALLALGPSVFPTLTLFVAEGKDEDPDRAFAASLVLGSLEGHDTAGVLCMLVKQSRPEAYPGFREGLALAPSPAIDEAMVELASSTRAPWVELGLEVLIARRAFSIDLARRRSGRSDGPRIEALIARGLRDVADREGASRLLTSLLHHENDDVALAAAASSLILGDESAHDVLFGWVRAPSTPRRARGALVLLLLTARDKLAPELLAAAAGMLDPEVARALGRSGLAAAPSILAARLGENEELDPALAEALERITGAGLRVTEMVPWDIDMPEGAPPIEPSLIPRRRVDRVSTDPAAWRVWLARHPLEQGTKWRGGRPFQLSHGVDELESLATPPERRPEAALELQLLAGPGCHFDSSTWVARQVGRLAELRGVVERIRFAPGTFSVGLAPRPEAEVEAPAASVHAATIGKTMMGSVDLGAMVPFLRSRAGTGSPPSSPPPAPRPPSAPPPAAHPPSSPPAQQQTAAIDQSVIARAVADARALPFARGAGGPPAQAGSRGAPPGPQAPPQVASPHPWPPHGAPSAPPRMPLDRYAALCAAMAHDPRRSADTVASFGLPDIRAFRAIDEEWQARFRVDRPLEQTWRRLVDEARARLARGGG